MKGRVLVAGFATRHVAQSAHRAGYEVCAVDHFCDQDLTWCTADREKFEDLADLPEAIDRIAKRRTFDFFVATSGAEDLLVPVPLCGTPRDQIGRFLDKLETQHFFESCKVSVPRLLGNGEYPAMVKPRRGAGGWRNAIVRDDAGMRAWEMLYPEIPFILQELVDGVPASVCCITDGTAARAITVNEQVLRGSGESAYGFCGSVTPSDHPRVPGMMAIAEKIAAASGCRGTIGIDFVAGDDTAWAIEVNPRFQGTVDTVERACGCSLFDLHVGACQGRLPASVPPAHQVAVRSILFADRDMTLAADLSPLKEFVSDIPWPGASFEVDQALVSINGWGPTRVDAYTLLDKHITTVRQYMR
ncbi:ATP-grasp domain-containing protein [Methanoregula sp.]|uniref:ATP-grasp domain-containing protein n=1 Tax=Methanoregula sp. TaxID=2052170 RepID=UPI003C259AAC